MKGEDSTGKVAGHESGELPAAPPAPPSGVYLFSKSVTYTDSQINKGRLVIAARHAKYFPDLRTPQYRDGRRSPVVRIELICENRRFGAEFMRDILTTCHLIRNGWKDVLKHGNITGQDIIHFYRIDLPPRDPVSRMVVEIKVTHAGPSLSISPDKVGIQSPINDPVLPVPLHSIDIDKECDVATFGTHSSHSAFVQHVNSVSPDRIAFRFESSVLEVGVVRTQSKSSAAVENSAGTGNGHAALHASAQSSSAMGTSEKLAVDHGTRLLQFLESNGEKSDPRDRLYLFVGGVQGGDADSSRSGKVLTVSAVPLTETLRVSLLQDVEPVRKRAERSAGPGAQGALVERSRRSVKRPSYRLMNNRYDRLIESWSDGSSSEKEPPKKSRKTTEDSPPSSASPPPKPAAVREKRTRGKGRRLQRHDSSENAVEEEPLTASEPEPEPEPEPESESESEGDVSPDVRPKAKRAQRSPASTPDAPDYRRRTGDLDSHGNLIAAHMNGLGNGRLRITMNEAYRLLNTHQVVLWKFLTASDASVRKSRLVLPKNQLVFFPRLRRHENDYIPYDVKDIEGHIFPFSYAYESASFVYCFRRSWRDVVRRFQLKPYELAIFWGAKPKDKSSKKDPQVFHSGSLMFTIISDPQDSVDMIAALAKRKITTWREIGYPLRRIFDVNEDMFEKIKARVARAEDEAHEDGDEEASQQRESGHVAAPKPQAPAPARSTPKKMRRKVSARAPAEPAQRPSSPPPPSYSSEVPQLVNSREEGADSTGEPCCNLRFTYMNVWVGSVRVYVRDLRATYPHVDFSKDAEIPVTTPDGDTIMIRCLAIAHRRPMTVLNFPSSDMTEKLGMKEGDFLDIFVDTSGRSWARVNGAVSPAERNSCAVAQAPPARMSAPALVRELSPLDLTLLAGKCPTMNDVVGRSVAEIAVATEDASASTASVSISFTAGEEIAAEQPRPVRIRHLFSAQVFLVAMSVKNLAGARELLEKHIRASGGEELHLVLREDELQIADFTVYARASADVFAASPRCVVPLRVFSVLLNDCQLHDGGIVTGDAQWLPRYLDKFCGLKCSTVCSVALRATVLHGAQRGYVEISPQDAGVLARAAGGDKDGDGSGIYRMYDAMTGKAYHVQILQHDTGKGFALWGLPTSEEGAEGAVVADGRCSFCRDEASGSIYFFISQLKCRLDVSCRGKTFVYDASSTLVAMIRAQAASSAKAEALPACEVTRCSIPALRIDPSSRKLRTTVRARSRPSSEPAAPQFPPALPTNKYLWAGCMPNTSALQIADHNERMKRGAAALEAGEDDGFLQFADIDETAALLARQTGRDAPPTVLPTQYARKFSLPSTHDATVYNRMVSQFLASSGGALDVALGDAGATEVPGKNGFFYHSLTLRPIAEVDEGDVDSDSDIDDAWILSNGDASLANAEIPKHVEDFMHMWNSFVATKQATGDKEAAALCEDFARAHATELADQTMRQSLLLHLFTLWERSVISTNSVASTIRIVDTAKAVAEA